MNIYCVFDKIAKKTFATFSAPNDGLAVRENVRGIARVMPLGDCELRCVGVINDDTSVVSSSNVRLVDWDSYKFPENPLTPLSENSEVKPVSVANNTSVK